MTEYQTPIPSPLELETAVFAAYGGAMATIATVERNLHLAIVTKRIAAARRDGRVLTGDPFQKAARLGFQEAVDKVAPQCDRDPELASDLTSVVKRRNDLAHNFWFNNVYAALADETRSMLLAELLDDIRAFESIDARLVQTVVDPGLADIDVDPDAGKIAFLATLKALEEQGA